MLRKTMSLLGLSFMVVLLATTAFAAGVGYFPQVVTDKPTTVEAGTGALAGMCEVFGWSPAAPIGRTDYEKVGAPLGPVKIDCKGRALANKAALDPNVMQKLGEAAGLDWVVVSKQDVSCRTVRNLIWAGRKASAPTVVVVRDIRNKLTYTYVSDPNHPAALDAQTVRRVWAGGAADVLAAAIWTHNIGNGATIWAAPAVALLPQIWPEGCDDELEAATVRLAISMAAADLQKQMAAPTVIK